MGAKCTIESSISVILRASMASLLGVAALAKFTGGLAASAEGIIGMFQGTLLPSVLVSLYAYILPFAEASLAIWLILGTDLKQAWTCTGYLLVTLAFGLVVTKNPNAAQNYIYILVACAGLYFSPHDTCCLIKKKK